MALIRRAPSTVRRPGVKEGQSVRCHTYFLIFFGNQATVRSILDNSGLFKMLLQVLDVIEILATLLFTVEYGLRYFSAPEAP